jgi:hypothetical protein
MNNPFNNSNTFNDDIKSNNSFNHNDNIDNNQKNNIKIKVNIFMINLLIDNIITALNIIKDLLNNTS